MKEEVVTETEQGPKVETKPENVKVLKVNLEELVEHCVEEEGIEEPVGVDFFCVGCGNEYA